MERHLCSLIDPCCSSTCPTCPYPPTCIIIQHCFRGLQKRANLQSRDESTPRNRYGSCSHQKSELSSYFAHEIVRSPDYTRVGRAPLWVVFAPKE